MALRIAQWWTAYFLGGFVIGLFSFSLMAILLGLAVAVDGSHVWIEVLIGRSENITTALTIGGIILTIICTLFATYTLFLVNSDNGIRSIPPFRLRVFFMWWVKGLIYSTNPSNVLDDFIGFRRK